MLPSEYFKRRCDNALDAVEERRQGEEGEALDAMISRAIRMPHEVFT